jgi:hypothetical protein
MKQDVPRRLKGITAHFSTDNVEEAKKCFSLKTIHPQNKKGDLEMRSPLIIDVFFKP